MEDKVKKLFDDCKGVLIIGVDNSGDVQQELRRIKKAMGYTTEKTKYMTIEFGKESENCTYTGSKRV